MDTAANFIAAWLQNVGTEYQGESAVIGQMLSDQSKLQKQHFADIKSKIQFHKFGGL